MGRDRALGPKLVDYGRLGNCGHFVGSLATNALVLIECGANLPDGWRRGISAGGATQSEERSQFFAEHLLNNKLQMTASSATRKVVTRTKQTKIGPYEQVRVN